MSYDVNSKDGMEHTNNIVFYMMYFCNDSMITWNYVCVCVCIERHQSNEKQKKNDRKKRQFYLMKSILFLL